LFMLKFFAKISSKKILFSERIKKQKSQTR
jgi:hypothetical protein